jgi:LPS sulfotransferase NodH
VYDGPAIAYLIATISRQSARWDAALESSGSRVCHVFYEDLVSDYKAVTRAVLEFIGVDPTLARHLRPRLKRLSDDVTEAWVQRARAEFASGSGAAPNQL